MRRRYCALVGVLLALATVGTAAGRRPAASMSFHRLWSVAIQPNADSVPAYASGIHLPGGGRGAVVYTLAGNNGSNCSPGDPVTRATLTAFSASNGHKLWS